MSPAKRALLEIANALTDDCTWEDAMYRLFIRQKSEEGLRGVEAEALLSEVALEEEFESELRRLQVRGPTRHV